MTSELVIRFDYGLTVPWVARGPHRELLATAGPLKLVFRSGARSVGRNMRTLSHFKLGPGERVAFTLQCVDSVAEIPPPMTPTPPWSARANSGPAGRRAAATTCPGTGRCNVRW